MSSRFTTSLSHVKNWWHQQNVQQKRAVLTGFIGECTTILIANCFTFTIPQSGEITSPYDLIFTQRFNVPIPSRIIIIVNCVTVVCILAVYIYEVYREFWLVNHFDYSKRYDSMHLRSYKSTYPELFTYLERLNMHYSLLYKCARMVCVCNIVISACIICIYSYGDYHTATTLFTNSWVVWGKVAKGCEIAGESLAHHIGYSYYNTQNLSYNRIDARIKRHVSQSNLSVPGGGDNSSVGSRAISRRNSFVLPNSEMTTLQNRSLTSSFNEAGLKVLFDGVDMMDETNVEADICESHVE
jgi:hypothetical protein